MKHGSTQTLSAEQMFQNLKEEIAELNKQLELQTYFKKAIEIELERVCKQYTKLSRENQIINSQSMAF